MVVQFLSLIAMQTQFADKLFVAGRLSWLLRDFFQDDGVGEQAVFFLSPRRGSVLSLCEPSHGSRRVGCILLPVRGFVRAVVAGLPAARRHSSFLLAQHAEIFGYPLFEHSKLRARS
jgi:hypothetical protein